MDFNRRQFLQMLGLTPLLLSRAGKLLSDPLPLPWRRSVILVELAGGNDGLNTVVPWSDPAYRQARPTLALEASDILQLSQTLGLNARLAPLAPAWEAGELAILNGLGYPDPNRSHFRSIDIWETGSDADEALADGWACRCLNGQLPPELALEALVLGDAESGPAAGEGLKSLVLDDIEAFFDEARRLRRGSPGPTGRPALDHLLDVQTAVLDAAAELESRLADSAPISFEFPPTGLGRQLELVARILAAGVPLPLAKVTLGGFDTHAAQRRRHDGLLGQLADGLSIFREALRGTGHWDEAVVVTYSEFGRRVSENASGGTDHGAAAPHLVMGGIVEGGFYGPAPDLDVLVDGDVRHTADFRSLYGTLCDRWWAVESPFSADDFPRIDFLPAA